MRVVTSLNSIQTDLLLATNQILLKNFKDPTALMKAGDKLVHEFFSAAGAINWNGPLLDRGYTRRFGPRENSSWSA